MISIKFLSTISSKMTNLSMNLAIMVIKSYERKQTSIELESESNLKKKNSQNAGENFSFQTVCCFYLP